jgi:hypothetical protein
VSDGRPRRRLVFDLDDLPRGQPLEHRLGDPLGNLLAPRHSQKRLPFATQGVKKRPAA